MFLIVNFAIYHSSNNMINLYKYYTFKKTFNLYKFIQRIFCIHPILNNQFDTFIFQPNSKSNYPQKLKNFGER